MILLNDFKRQWTDTGQDVLASVARVGESGWYILGAEVREFESALAARWSLNYTVGVASGLDAIELSLRALGCGPGDFVLTSPISAFATVLAILKIGARPVFVDCDEYGLIDLGACRDLLEKRRDIRYFVPVHLYGHSLDLAELRSLRDDFDLRIVEDCAQSIGAAHGGNPSGSVGQCAATSFYPTKNLGALGDAGAVLTNDTGTAALLRHFRDYGQSSRYRHDIIGYNSRLDELQAAILKSAFLPRLAGWTSARRRIAAAYIKGIDATAIRVPGQPDGSDSCWHLFPILVAPERKAEAMAWFAGRKIAVAEHYPLVLIDQAAMDPFRECAGSDCPRARTFCQSEISLPIHPYLRDEEIAAVIQACNEWR